jgi:hypothetical protein
LLTGGKQGMFGVVPIDALELLAFPTLALAIVCATFTDASRQRGRRLGPNFGFGKLCPRCALYRRGSDFAWKGTLPKDESSDRDHDQQQSAAEPPDERRPCRRPHCRWLNNERLVVLNSRPLVPTVVLLLVCGRELSTRLSHEWLSTESLLSARL